MNVFTYLLPFRRAVFDGGDMDELATYLNMLAQHDCEVLVIDGSPSEVFARHAAVFGNAVTHRPVDRRFRCKNDKVNGVHTGVELAACEKIILADDDIRYTPDDIGEILRLLDDYEVVRPQNYLRGRPCWALMEAARMLINRATLRTGDYPGTCAFRRETMRRVEPYDGDVLFDNEEIIRNFALHGATIAYALDLLVEKRAPRWKKWLEQRPRQAYEDFGLRSKTLFFALLLPLVGCFTLLYGATGLLLGLGIVVIGSILLALRGRSRGEATTYFSLRSCFFAPLWILERSCSTYWAFYWYLTRGGYPFGNTILSKGIGRAWKRGARAAGPRTF
jgi:hypothetical protein